MGIIIDLVVTITGNFSTDLMEWLGRKIGNTAFIRRVKKRLNPEQLHPIALNIIQESVSDTIRELNMDNSQLSKWKDVLIHPENRIQIIGWVFDWEKSAKPKLEEWSLENAPNQEKLKELLLTIHDKIQKSKYQHFSPEFHNLLLTMQKGNKQLFDDHLEMKQKLKRIEEFMLSRENQDNESKTFEKDYLDYLDKTYSRLRMIGVREMRNVKQKLSIAYVSLKIQSCDDKESGPLPQPAETVLLNHDLLTIRGAAGSGKTTLLHWIITQCSNPDIRSIPYREKRSAREVDGIFHEKINSWMGMVPFFVPLRSIENERKGKPDVARFINYSSGEIPFNKKTPDGWIDDILLNQKRGIVLIDGVDELSENDRYNFWEWLRYFMDSYEGTRIVITSRRFPEKGDPDKVNPKEKQYPQWDTPKEFHNTELEDMNGDDIKEFINNWHKAVLEYETDSQTIAELKRRGKELPVKLLEDPSNRRVLELSRSPLLCALVCVIHWKEEGYLPQKRIDLYERCCQMLIDERDRKRELLPPKSPLCHLDQNDKDMILQRLALDMLRNKTVNGEEQFATEVSRGDAISWIRIYIHSVKDTRARKCEAEDVLKLLILRTSLLREPSNGRVDFPHRTFQEYLAACAAGVGTEGEDEAAGGFCDELVSHANDDPWRQTIILAAGTKTGGVPFGRRLVRTLFERGEKLYKKRKTQNEALSCFALSVACLETFKGHDPELRARVASKLGIITPPLDFDQSISLSAAGDALVDHIRYEKIKDRDETVVRSCVKALSMVESRNALLELKDNYSRDKRESVISDICAVPVINPLELDFVIQHVREKGTLPDYAGKYVRDLKPLSKEKKLQRLDLSNAYEIKSIFELFDLIELRFLSLRCCEKIEDISPISKLKKLEKLDLGYCIGIKDFSPVQDLPNLKSLDLQGIKIPKNLQLPESIPPEPKPGIDFLEISEGLYMKMIWIEKGSFLMGSPEDEQGRWDDRESPVHRVHLDGFWISSVPITQKHYQYIIGKNPSHFKGENNPVECVTWHKAKEFCDELSKKSGREYAFPTEAQWEFACRAGSKGRFCFGDSDQRLEHYAWYGKGFEGKTHPVGLKRPNDWGVFDMHGNVWEWCHDWYGEYKDGEFRNPKGPEKGESRMLRGGSWVDESRYCRSAFRLSDSPVVRGYDLGVRVVLVLRTQ